jgi:hypothetical protein
MKRWLAVGTNQETKQSGGSFIELQEQHPVRLAAALREVLHARLDPRAVEERPSGPCR